MYFLCFLFIGFAFLISFGSVLLLAKPLWQDTSTYSISKVERGFITIFTLFVVISVVLWWSLLTSDFTLVYTANYTDKALPFFYKITGFWAGQAGSLLFWFNAMLLFNFCFILSRNYKELNDEIKSWYWIFYYIYAGFFCFLLLTWNNPFLVQYPPPLDGNGLNPALQNIAMIIHPPLLILGYAGFIIPAALAFAYILSKTKDTITWIERIRTPFLLAWVFLSSGILLGGWWAYMELGWGGYWAWDPVENASFIPWLIATAYLHTAMIETQRNKLHRLNFFLVTLTALSTIFATYIVRGGIVPSVHTFASSLGTPLLLFVLLGLALSVFIALCTPPKNTLALDNLNSKEGILVLMSWLLLASGIIIIFATLWPVLTKLFTDQPIGLTETFYNDVVLPLFIVVIILLTVCYTMSWKKGVRSIKELAIPIGMGAFTILISYLAGYTKPMPLLAIGASIAVFYTAKLLFIPTQYKYMSSRYLTGTIAHLGFAIIVFGIAFSGSFKVTKEIELTIGQTLPFEGYEINYEKFETAKTEKYSFHKIFLVVTKNGKYYGTLVPEKRLYYQFPDMSFAEASTIPSLYKELYVSVLNVTDKNGVFISMHVEPFVNWIWIGGILLCIAPLLSLGRKGKNTIAREKESI